jgi:hypothetical protein
MFVFQYFSSIAAPLDELLRDGVKWQWTTKKEQPFQQMKQLFLKCTQLDHPLEKDNFIVQTDSTVQLAWAYSC